MATFLCFSNVLLKQGFLYSEYFKGLILRKVSRLMKHYLRYKREEVKDSEVSFECYQKSKRTKATWGWYDLDQAALRQTPFTWGPLTERAKG